MSKVEIELHADGEGKIAVDGSDISTAVHSFNFAARAGYGPNLHLELSIHDIAKVGAENVTVWMSSGTAALLERAGWTPPPGREPMLLEPAAVPAVPSETGSDQEAPKEN